MFSEMTFDEHIKSEHPQGIISRSKSYSKTSIKEANDQLKEMFEKMVKLEKILDEERKRFFSKCANFESKLKQKDLEIENLSQINKNLIQNRENYEIIISTLEQKVANLLKEKSNYDIRFKNLHEKISEISDLLK
ncbi:unnamed protein product [Brachionus calyciflorus]|uniref:Uncharacterized protein n=1 Tax=Brachionus calyciflorus TaxID=104777 RepID=A0A813UY34_9BILA|nr:unnamed protein product [Brachionus calyciflorus]